MPRTFVFVIAVGIWWISNTVAHIFIHRPFFRTRAANQAFSICLSVLLGIPQMLWRDHHLAHHRGQPWRWRSSPRLLSEIGLVIAGWALMAFASPIFFAATYLPGYALGLGLCALHGYYEHAGGVTSYYGRAYNFLCFNDGFHVEHHANPAIEWASLPDIADPHARVSRWPPLLRWLDDLTLEGLERLVLHSRRLQIFILRSHRRAFAALLPSLSSVHRIAIIGGGLFPRTALILRELLPEARITIIDASAQNLATARALLGSCAIESERRFYEPQGESSEFDLVVIPLSFQGDRREIYRRPPSKAILIHDWIWRRRGNGRVISFPLLKRLNLILQ